MSLNEFQHNVLEKAAKTTGYGGHAAKSCARHIERARLLKDCMPELAVFSAITAEEEAAVAIFYALKKQKYENYEQLKTKVHSYKSGVYPFIRLLGEAFLPKESDLKITLYFEELEAKKRKDILRIRMPIGIEDDQQICIVPDPPLGFVSTGPDGKEKNYHREVSRIASEKGIKSVFDYIKNLANERNKVLYASPTQIPRVKDAEDVISNHTNAAMLNMIMYLLIEPHRPQSLVQEALKAYVKIMTRIDASET